LIEILQAMEHRSECKNHLRAIVQFVMQLEREPEVSPIVTDQQKFSKVVDRMTENDCLDDDVVGHSGSSQSQSEEKATALTQLLIHMLPSPLNHDMFMNENSVLLGLRRTWYWLYN
jgi:hypothetical protein